MVRYQVILAYDGAGFCGFQRQAKGRSVQAVVEKALRQIHWQGRYILSAGRTDAGVHATGQVIAFDLDWRHSIEDLRQAINASLPQDIVARTVIPVHPSFNPRRDALSRTYIYHIFSQDVRDPLQERYAWRVWPAPDFQVLQQAAETLIGKHDFTAFGAPPRAGGSTVRTVFQAAWQHQGQRCSFSVTADAFLYHMVRRMVALQVAIGQGKLDASKVFFYLQPPEQRMEPFYVQGLAPAHGLFLVEVFYPAHKLTTASE